MNNTDVYQNVKIENLFDSNAKYRCWDLGIHVTLPTLKPHSSASIFTESRARSTKTYNCQNQTIDGKYA